MTNVVIGLGGAGTSVVEKLAELKMKVSFFSIDTEKSTINEAITFIKVPSVKNVEEYETKFPKVLKYFKGAKGNKLLLITAGGGNLSFCSLSLLQQLKSKFEITVLYIKPETELLSDLAQTKERIVYNVFQEYARSGLFEKLYIISNKSVREWLGGLSILSYNEKINEAIASIYYTIDSLKKIKSVFNTFHEPPVGARIGTIGVFDTALSKESSFFELDTVTDTVYYFGYTENTLKTNTNVLDEIKQFLFSGDDSKQRISYGIFATKYKNDFVYFLKFTSEIQT